MRHTTTYIEAVLDTAVSTMDTISTNILNAAKNGQCHRKDTFYYRQIFLLTVALESWNQDADGDSTGYTNSLEEEDKDKIIHLLRKLCTEYL